jgi:hypothetical protein
MPDSTDKSPTHAIHGPVRIGFLLWVALSGTLWACGVTQTNDPAPRTPGTSAVSADGGLPAPRPTRSGVIVPGDTGVGNMPSGRGPATGTSGHSPEKSFGNQSPGSGN